jgi:uncharacterized membrane protein YfcA
MFALVTSFFIIALLYATVGFGGGSSYLAALAVANVPFALIPKIGLVCNLLVVTGGCWLFYKKGHFSKKLILPFVLSSVPMAFIGGIYPIKEKTFMILLGFSLMCAALRLLFVRGNGAEDTHIPPLKVSVPVGAGLGLLSGMVGIGGGIFLSPLMLTFKWGKPKEVAAAASAFIWLNSAAGLAGQLIKDFKVVDDLSHYGYLFAAVLLGGQIGSRISTHSKIQQVWIQNATAVLVLFISTKLLIKAF